MNRSRFCERKLHFGQWKLLGLSLLVGFLCACKSEPPVATIVVVNKKILLTEWPDSLYIADLDSILALEPIKKKDKNQPSIAMNTFKAPNFILPSSVTGKNAAKETRGNQGSRTGEAQQCQALQGGGIQGRRRPVPALEADLRCRSPEPPPLLRTFYPTISKPRRDAGAPECRGQGTGT